MNPADGVWYSSQNARRSGVFNCATVQSCSASWSQIQASYPNAKVVFGLGPEPRHGWHVRRQHRQLHRRRLRRHDRLRLRARLHDRPATSTRSAATTSTPAAPGDPLQTIQAGVNKVHAGGTVAVAAGTYAENVVGHQDGRHPRRRRHDDRRAGRVEPELRRSRRRRCAPARATCSSSRPTTSTIEHLVVDGDNPSLTGLSIGGADVDARNGIITEPRRRHVQRTHGPRRDRARTSTSAASTPRAAARSRSPTTPSTTCRATPASIGIFNFVGGGTISRQRRVQHQRRDLGEPLAGHARSRATPSRRSGSGVHTDNAGDSGGTADVISGNNVSACTAGRLRRVGVRALQGRRRSATTPCRAATSALAAFASCNLAGSNNCPGGVVPTVTLHGQQHHRQRRIRRRRACTSRRTRSGSATAM